MTFLILTLLLSLLAHHFSPQLVTMAYTLLSLTARGERWKPGQALPQVTPVQVLGVPWPLSCMAGVPLSLAAAAPWSLPTMLEVSFWFCFLYLFLVLRFPFRIVPGRGNRTAWPQPLCARAGQEHSALFISHPAKIIIKFGLRSHVSLSQTGTL